MTTQRNETSLSQADEIEAMLPWLVAGKLDKDEAARIARYLDAHPETAAHVALAREEQDAVIAGNESVKAPSPVALDRLMAQVAATPQPRSLSVPSPKSVWERIAGVLTSFTPTTLGIAGAAAALVLVIQAVTIGALVTRDGGAGYSTASDGEKSSTAGGVQALVTLQPGVTAGALTTALKDLDAAIVDGPKAGNVYRLRVAADAAQADATLAKIKSRADIFVFVGPASR